MPNRKKSFQEVTTGDCYVNTGYVLRFKMKAVEKLLCEKTLTREEVAKFRDAILNETPFSCLCMAPISMPIKLSITRFHGDQVIKRHYRSLKTSL